MLKMFKKAMDPISSETHFIGALLSFVGLLAMIIISLVTKASTLTLVSICVFGSSSVALYLASFIYHYYNASDLHPVKKRLRTMDHAMIYVLIAGTYTPIALTFLETPHNYYFTICIWSIALLGIISKLFWLQAPRFISTFFYLAMGWALLFDFPAFYQVPFGCFVLLALGGISYSIGAVVYIVEKPNWLASFGFHELFHIFVMIGSLFHFLAVFIYVL